jgi:Pyridoxamine 5'-phosphate oxidase
VSKELREIDPDLAAWIAAQRIFFVATAPLAADGHVNLSPKGGDTFRLLSPTEAVYQDYTGSGAESVAHVRENGRMAVMFCAFDGPPKIVRLHGHGTVIDLESPRFTEMVSLFPPHPGTRAFIHLQVTRISSSCGYAVPFYEFRRDRNVLHQWTAKKTPAELEGYRAKKNSRSIDGLPAFGPLA